MSRRKPSPTAIRDAVANWYLTAKSMIDQIYHTADGLRREAGQPGSPIAALLDEDSMRRLVWGLETASCAMGDIVPIVGDPLPDPLAVLRKK